MRILCLDPGSRHIGAAVSDEGGTVASEFGTYANNREFWPMISKIITEKKIELIVVGRPRQLDGTVAEESRRSEEFADRLRTATGADVVMEDETATSAEADERLRAEGIRGEQLEERIHSASAAVILEGYLASQAA